MHRRYALLLVGLSLVLAGGVAVWGHFLEPLTGDLTRIGWYAENDYGWRGTQLRFDPPAAEIGRLDGAYDVVAVGDSFTAESPHNPGVAWPHFLARATGRKVAVFDVGVTPLDDILASPAFSRHPPAVLIYEVVERHLVQHGTPSSEGCAPATPRPEAELELGPAGPAPVPFERSTRRFWDDWPVSYALEFAFQNARRRLAGHETTSAVGMAMMRGGLFSSRFDRGLLVYGEDFNKMGWSEADWRRAGCHLLALQDRVQANGRTVFVALVVPDKLTVYAPFLPYRKFDGISRLGLVAETPGLNLVRLDTKLDPTGQVDLYLPNDTHWSAYGHALAARTVVDWLGVAGVLRPASSAAASNRPAQPGAGG
jgi:hypothetical protein